MKSRFPLAVDFFQRTKNELPFLVNRDMPRNNNTQGKTERHKNPETFHSR
jgi:hypothetical protein